MEEQLYREFFLVEDRHWWFVGRRRIILDIIERGLALPPGSKVLDVGCGTGALLEALKNRYDVFGTDTSPLAIDYCKQRGLNNVYQCTVSNFPESKEKFDLVMLLDVVEHVEDDIGLLREAGKLLKESGRILVTVPAYQFLWSHHDELNHHKRRYTRGKLAKDLRAAGYSVRRITYFNTILFPAALVERLIQKLSPPPKTASLPIPPNPVNAVLTALFSAERHLLRILSPPFGLSILALAEKG